VSVTDFDNQLVKAKAASNQDDATAHLMAAVMALNEELVEEGRSQLEADSLVGEGFDIYTSHAFSVGGLKKVPQKLEEKIQALLRVLPELAAKFHPLEYSITVGFPLGVSVTVTWDAQKSD